MNRTLVKIISFGAVMVALIILGRVLYYSPDPEDAKEVDSGVAIGSQLEGAVVAAASNAELPSRLIIPKLDIDTKVQRLGTTKSGNMAAPSNFTDVSWYKLGTVPGKLGSAVMAGHVDNALGTPAIFYDLKDLEMGDDIYVVRADGKRLRFRVIDEEIYRYDKSPVQKIFNDRSGIYLNLITCQGEWVPAAKSAEFRLVVFAKLVE